MYFMASERDRQREPVTNRIASLVVGCCVAAVVATAFPWTRGAFENRWGAHDGPLGWRTDAGFTCLTTCLLTVTMVGIEGRSPHNQQTARSTIAILLGIATLTLVIRVWNGAGSLHGVTAEHTAWFAIAAVLVPIAALASGWRLRALRAVHESRG
jgi:hypothetical protein